MRVLTVLFAALGLAVVRQPGPAIDLTEFVANPLPTPSCHASTIVETPSGLVAAWFGGTRERHPDVGIWVARHVEGRWTPPVEVANGVQADGTRQPTWNPVLFQPAGGPLLLFYKVGPSPSQWWGMLKTSRDAGRTWSEGRRLPDGILGPIKNKPIQLAGGELLCGSSAESKGWTVHFERTADAGVTWRTTGPLNDPSIVSAIQPAILRHRDGRLQAVVRTRQGSIYSTESRDEGKSWSPLAPLGLPNPNSGLDAVTLADGRFLLVFNDAKGEADGGRGVLRVALSSDGRAWKRVLTLENEAGQEFSYPAVIQSSDGRVHVTYTWKRRLVRHVVIDPNRL
jgi:predicted neuraminidase